MSSWLALVLLASSGDPLVPTDPPRDTPLTEEPLYDEAPSAADVTEPGYRWYAIPALAYDTDDLLGAGARGELARVEPGIEPYRTAYSVAVFWAVSGYQHHRVSFDHVDFGPGDRLRFTASLAWRQWLNDGYFGIGNGAPREAGAVEAVAKVYRYALIQPFFYSTLRVRLSEGWDAFVATNLKHSEVRPYARSLLLAQQPYGMDGGWNLQGFAGLIYDSRFPEISPERGFFFELSGRASPRVPDGDGQYVGVLASVRAYASLHRRLVVAGRLMSELLSGEVPFYELVHWGGSTPISGFGGWQTVRGIYFGRFRAPGKLVANLELRWDGFGFTLFDNPVLVQLVPFVDAGAVFAAREAATAPAPEDYPFHPGFGAGARVIYDEIFVIRADVAYGLDPLRRADGQIRREPTFGFYLVAGHLF